MREGAASMRWRRFRLWTLALLCGAGVGVAGLWVHRNYPRLPQVEPTRTVSAEDRQVNLLALGDWGDDNWAQAEVADGMAQYTQRRIASLDGVLLLGDNFYSPLQGIDDPRWDRLFEQMYDPQSLDAPFYAAMGNHDYYEANGSYLLEYSSAHANSRWNMPARWYRLELPAEAPLVTVLVLDSNYESLSTEEWADQGDWLAAELQKPRQTPWLIVAAHHPLYSDGKHGDDSFLGAAWGELLKRHGVDFYLCGHDHNLQHLRLPDRDTDFVISGGGGRGTRDLQPNIRGPFAAEIHGFAHLRLSAQAADVRLVDKHGRIIHAFSRQASDDAEARLSGADAALAVTTEHASE